ncbi:MAG: AAA family ATPase [Nitrososphaerota archaeon]|nr:AAA family ATPase [Nitrososphaerota archaeon]
MGVAGSPSVGKSTLSVLVAKRLGLPHLDVSKVAREAKAGGFDNQGMFVLNIRKARNAVRETLLKDRVRGYVVEGSFLWDLVPKSMLDLVVVLRCDPLILEKRYRRTGYSQQRIADNVVGELIGYVSAKCFEVYGEKCVEIDISGKDVSNAVEKILYAIESKRGEVVDWLASASSKKRLLKYLS